MSDALRSAFPLFNDVAYLNAGSCGPLPQAAVDAQRRTSVAAASDGRGPAFFKSWKEAHTRLRDRYATLLGASPDHVALTSGTSDAMVRVLTATQFRPGDEIVTSDAEHPGLLGPRAALRRRRGVTLREVPLAQVPEAVNAKTRFVACSHVGWVSGDIVPDGIRDLDVPVLLDGAQGVGAIPVGVDELGCDFYAGAGQKWLCGPIGTGMLWVAPAWIDRLEPYGPTFNNLADPGAGIDSELAEGARRYDALMAPDLLTAATASYDVLERFGWRDVHSRASDLAGRLAASLSERGLAVAERGPTTLVSWRSDDATATVSRLRDAAVVLRELPGRGLLRASVGAWNNDADLERLLDLL